MDILTPNLICKHCGAYTRSTPDVARILADWLRTAEAGRLAVGGRKLKTGEAAVVRASLHALADAVGGLIPLMPTDPNVGVPDAQVVSGAKVRVRAREVSTDG